MVLRSQPLSLLIAWCSYPVVAVLLALALLAPLASLGTSSVRSGLRFTTLAAFSHEEQINLAIQALC